MKKRLLTFALLASVLTLRAQDDAYANETHTPEAPVASPTANSPVKVAAENAQRLLTSLRDGKRAVFLENGSEKFQTAMTESLFNEARTKLGPILNREANLDYLGSLHKGPDTVYLYRLRPEKGGDDNLVTLAMRGSTVVGFFVN